MVRPSPEWVCLNGGWLPPTHPLVSGKYCARRRSAESEAVLDTESSAEIGHELDGDPSGPMGVNRAEALVRKPKREAGRHRIRPKSAFWSKLQVWVLAVRFVVPFRSVLNERISERDETRNILERVLALLEGLEAGEDQCSLVLFENPSSLRVGPR
jgi:hypothetical protein